MTLPSGGCTGGGGTPLLVLAMERTRCWCAGASGGGRAPSRNVNGKSIPHTRPVTSVLSYARLTARVGSLRAWDCQHAPNLKYSGRFPSSGSLFF